MQQSIDISRWPGAQQQTCSSGISAVGQTDGWTDGRTPDRCIDPIPHSMQVVPINVGPLNPIVCQHGNTKGHLTERSVYGTLVRVHVSTCWRLQQTFYTNNFTTKCNENYVSNVCCTQFRIVMVCFTFFPITVFRIALAKLNAAKTHVFSDAIPVSEQVELLKFFYHYLFIN